MNIDSVISPVGSILFRAWRSATVSLPGGKICVFGRKPSQIGAIVVVNLDRQPQRWHRVSRELARFRTSDGARLTTITRRLRAVDARDGRRVAATGDVDALYSVGDQLFVQPDARLAAYFSVDDPVRMTRQELAVAQSHIEAWKVVANGAEEYVLVLEDDVWFRPSARASIVRGWRAALRRCAPNGGPNLLYLSYEDAGDRAAREDASDCLFRPTRGLWFLSGYVLSRDGASALLRSMPVVGPVDLWMNYQFGGLGALALRTPAIAQRRDEVSDNAYSILPYLARAGIVDSDRVAEPPSRTLIGPVLAWTGGGTHQSLAMALSMLGFRVCAFDGGEDPMHEQDFRDVIGTFDAVVDAPLTPAALAVALASESASFILEADASNSPGLDLKRMSSSRLVLLPSGASERPWGALCAFLGLDEPVDPFPVGVAGQLSAFRHLRPAVLRGRPALGHGEDMAMDDSPWVLPASAGWRPAEGRSFTVRGAGQIITNSPLTGPSESFPCLTGTFPGNLASFEQDGVRYCAGGTELVLDAVGSQVRPYRSGALASDRSYAYGRFEVDIRAARGAGLVTGFFLHRDAPRQEVDIEFAGNDPRRMMVNVYFNPGDEGAAMSYGYRGSPIRVDLGFDATEEFHRYAIDWRPNQLTWLVDGHVVHQRVSWDPTPIPHLGMRAHANLWTPRSVELAGRLDEHDLPARSAFRNISVTN